MSPLLFASLRQAVRPALRSGARFNSSKPPPSPEKKAQEVISNAQKTAGELGKNAGQLWSSAKTTLGPVVEKAEVLVGCTRTATLQRLGPTGQKVAEAIVPARKSFVYNLAVAREVVKQVYRAELQPPKDIATFRTAYETLYRRAVDPTYWRGIVQSGEIARVAVYAVEAYGIFKIGEIIGRRKLVGYPIH
ncbi:mitochondrial ATP synthase g subunit-domain-containing protein [Mycena pura]|uniref:Mitochondrial ATP synthase g subunit-domain-containing protein n=1 Tax=Mycena pura TaxID=153505 RepID=A0AAD6YS80_9AGAR|nr:mitochondrial ATP synthase g subunit-domain-containing protein [Mycena pura]